MKKILLIALVFMLLFTSVACDNKCEDDEMPSKSTEITTTKIPGKTITYPERSKNSPSSTPITVYTKYYRDDTKDDEIYTLTDEDSDIIKSLLNELEWEYGACLKVTYEYMLELPDALICYTPEYSVLNDWDTIRTVQLNEEQKNIIDSILGHEESAQQ